MTSNSPEFSGFKMAEFHQIRNPVRYNGLMKMASRLRKWSYFGTMARELLLIATHQVCGFGFYPEWAEQERFDELCFDLAGCLDSGLL